MNIQQKEFHLECKKISNRKRKNGKKKGAKLFIYPVFGRSSADLACLMREIYVVHRHKSVLYDCIFGHQENPEEANPRIPVRLQVNK